MENLIQKYLTNTITKEEVRELEEWLNEKDNEEIFKNYIKENHQLDLIYNSSIDTKNALKRVHKKVTFKNKVTLFNKSFLKYAAILIIALGSFFLYHQYNTNEKEFIFDYTSQIVLELNDGSKFNLSDKLNEAIKNKKGQLIATIKEGQLVYRSAGPSSSYHLVSVPNATVYKITLTDGTVVTINSGSTLKYGSNFSNKSSRKVFLNGEAFFDVAKNKNAPFIVNTKDMHIKVLGTRFNVSSYNNDKKSSVVLEEGSVSINKKSSKNVKNIILKPKEQFVLEKDKFSVKPVLVEKHIAWKKRKLHFSNDRFEDIIKEMERYYNLKINLNSSSLNNNRFTGTFTSETIEEVLNVFKELSEFKYTKKANTITISRIK